MLDMARSLVFHLCKYSHELLFTRFRDVENISFRVVTAVIDEWATSRPFHSPNRGIFFLDSFEHFPDVIDRHAEMIKTARIAWTTLVESNTNVTVTGYDGARESTRNAPRCQYFDVRLLWHAHAPGQDRAHLF